MKKEVQEKEEELDIQSQRSCTKAYDGKNIGKTIDNTNEITNSGNIANDKGV